MSSITVSQITANVSPIQKCWRLVHDGVSVLALFEGEGETWTINNLFCATEAKEIQAEIDRLGLKQLEPL